MNCIGEIKRFVLRALLRLDGLPWADALLDDAVRHAVMPRPIQSDINQKRKSETPRREETNFTNKHERTTLKVNSKEKTKTPVPAMNPFLVRDN